MVAGAVALALGVGVVSAGTASAAEPACGGGPILGQGSSLQGAAQTELWASANGGYNAACGEKQVQYTVSSSGKGLSAWGFKGGALDTTYGFVASDDGPNTTQIAAAKTASGTNILTIPVAQTAIAIPVNPPTNCTITEITNKQLEGVMRGTIKVWSKIQTASGAGCVGAPITRVVRKEGSGTTYQTKNYLAKISEASLTCLPASVKTPTWKGIEEIGPNAAEEPNTLWPENSAASGCTNQVTEVVRGEGGGGVVKKVNTTEGSIGYAALPDVEKNKNKGENPNGDTNWIKVQDNGVSNKLSVAKFASPLEAGNSANCFEAQYPVPTSAQVGAANPANADWSQIFGANTNSAAISPGAYPLCTLTYVEALTEYSKAGFSLETETTAKDYIANYLVAEGGQEALEVGGKWYAPLPEGTKSFNVLGAAQYAASKIAF
ncbi:MAG TPA: substrate-binding domain-containing protein [Solirubrobacterales bacterium]|nr:substrate-binding domain-containing protein [Solirubrobacterales bacterium]